MTWEEIMRRSVILGATILSAHVMLSAAQAQVSDDVVKIGILTDMSGPASTPTGLGSVTAAQMAVEDFGGTVLGKPIVVISGDHQLKPDICTGLVRRCYYTVYIYVNLYIPQSTVG